LVLCPHDSKGVLRGVSRASLGAVVRGEDFPPEFVKYRKIKWSNEYTLIPPLE